MNNKKKTHAVAANRFANWLSDKFNKNTQSWWFARLLRISYFEDFSALTGTELGFLLSMDTQNPEVISVTTQPGTCCTAKNLADILTSRDSESLEAVSALNRLGGTNGPSRGEWQIAIGTVLARTEEEFRIYVGTLDPSRSKYLLPALKSVGFFYCTLSEQTIEVVERIRAFATFIGLAKRFGPGGGYLFYFSANIPLSKDLISYVAEPLGLDSTKNLQRFADHFIQNVLVASNRYGWGIAVDLDGRLVYLKLEISSLSQIDLGAYNHFFRKQIRMHRNIEQQCDLQMQLRALSCKLDNKVPRILNYFSFTSIPDRISITTKNPTFINSVSQKRDTGLEDIILNESCKNNQNLIPKVIRRALDTIIRNQSLDGAWRDFNIPGMGISDSWVSAHVGLKLAELPSPWTDLTRKSVCAAIEYLTKKWPYGCAYNERSPIDADSTAHVVLLLQTVRGRAPPEAIDILLEFQQSDGGFSTFCSNGIRTDHSWCASHPDVTAMVVRALLSCDNTSRTANSIDRACRYMEKNRLDDQNWQSFWWNLHWYTITTWFSAKKNLGAKPFHYRWFENKSELFECTSYLDKALLLEFSAQTGKKDIAYSISHDLVQNQLSNGLWPVTPILRTPRKEDMEPWKANDLIYSDVQGIYSAATIVSSLAHFASVHSTT